MQAINKPKLFNTTTEDAIKILEEEAMKPVKSVRRNINNILTAATFLIVVMRSLLSFKYVNG